MQVNTAVSVRKGTLRGMHYQLAPHAEVKIVQCTRGSVYDVAVDLRPASPTFRRWAAVELSGHNYRAFYIPEGCAHGYLTLEDDVVLTYSTSPPTLRSMRAASASTTRHSAYNGRAPVQVISAADRGWPNFHSSEDKPVIIVDTALKKREQEGRPVTVAMVGAGYMARGIALEIITRDARACAWSAIANRNVAQAELAYSQAGITAQRAGGSVAAIEQAIAAGRHVVTDDPTLLCRAGGIDAIIESTGDVEVGAQIALEAIRNGKHIILDERRSRRLGRTDTEGVRGSRRRRLHVHGRRRARASR